MIGEEKSLASLTTLPPKKQLAFALLVFERMLPSLIAFSKDTGFDDSCYLRARDALWSVLRGSRDSDIDPSLSEACLSNAPDTDEFSHELTSHALNAALAIRDTVEFLIDHRLDHIAYISTLASDSVHLYLSSLSPSVVSFPLENKKIAEHPLMRQELGRQKEDIKFLAGLPDHFDENAVSMLKARASSQAPLLPCPCDPDQGNE